MQGQASAPPPNDKHRPAVNETTADSGIINEEEIEFIQEFCIKMLLSKHIITIFDQSFVKLKVEIRGRLVWVTAMMR